MKIEEDKKKMVDFSNISIGQCFRIYDDKQDVYIKTAIVDSMDLKINSVCLNDGIFANFLPLDKVIPLPNAKVVIE